MELVYYIVDVFTDTPFGGNQLAVFPHADGIEESLLQKIAREFNFSETSFVFPPENPKNDCRLRIFTPGCEVPTAGHPTIGTAFILLSEGLLSLRNQGKAVFEEKVGEILISWSCEDGFYHNIGMTQPLPVFGPVHNDPGILSAILSLQPEDIDKRFPVQSVSCGNNFLFIPLRNKACMADIKVRMDILEKYAEMLASTELYVFTTDTLFPDSTTHGRMFAPFYGITEDSATGSGSGPLGCYLVRHGISDGRNIICEQGFEMGRPSKIHVSIASEGGEITRVKVSGNAVRMAKGIFFVQNS